VILPLLLPLVLPLVLLLLLPLLLPPLLLLTKAPLFRAGGQLAAHAAHGDLDRQQRLRPWQVTRRREGAAASVQLCEAAAS